MFFSIFKNLYEAISTFCSFFQTTRRLLNLGLVPFVQCQQTLLILCNNNNNTDYGIKWRESVYKAKEQPAAKVNAGFSRINQVINTFLNSMTHTIILQQPPVNETESAERRDRAPPLHLLSWCPWKEKKKVIKRGGRSTADFFPFPRLFSRTLLWGIYL